MNKEILVEKDSKTGNYNISYNNRIYRTVYFDIHERAFYITDHREEFYNYRDAKEKAIYLVASEVFQKRKQDMGEVSNSNRTQEEIIEEQEEVIKVHEETIIKLKKKILNFQRTIKWYIEESNRKVSRR